MNVLVKFVTACGSHNSNRVARLSDAVGAGESQYWQGSYTYDGLGNRTQVVENGTTTTYQYDGENQLTTVQDGTGLVLASYTYDTHHNRTSQTTGSGTTSYGYDSVAGVELTSRTDPSGKQTTYAYDTSGNLTTATYDPTGADQVTRYAYDATGRLASISQPSGTTLAFRYDGDGNRLSKSSTTSGGSTTAVNDVYQLGHVAYETDATGTVLASFSYDSQGVPTSVRVGSDPTTAPVYYYVYNGHGDTIALTDATGLVVASYSYDAWGVVTSDTESFPNGWHNPYLYDGKDGARYDAETGLYWLAVRAYDPTLGRFISRDPLGRAPLIGWADQPYVYAGNNPLVNVDPTGQRFATAGAAQTRAAIGVAKRVARVQARRGCGLDCKGQIAKAKAIEFYARVLDGLAALLSLVQLGKDVYQLWQDWNTAGGLDRTLDIVGDAISIGADVAGVGVGVLLFASHWFDVSGALRVFHALAGILEVISAAYKAFLSASGWFIQVAKIAFFAAATAFKVGFGELNLPGLVLGLGLGLLKQMGFKVDGSLVFDAVMDGIQGAIFGVNWIVDGIQPLGGVQYCHQHMNECQ